MSDAAVPLLTYSERSLFRRCQFSLFADRLEVSGSRFITSDFEGIVRLAALSADVTRVRLRHPSWLAGLLMQMIPYSAFFILRGGRNLEYGFSFAFTASVWAFALVFGGIGWWLLIAGFPKKEFIIFRNQSGTVAFDVCRAGPDWLRFDEFVAAIQHEAELCRSVAGKTVP